jgi:hypothetical protein
VKILIPLNRDVEEYRQIFKKTVTFLMGQCSNAETIYLELKHV